eukprot:3702178-Prymnesium_polylepis.1
MMHTVEFVRCEHYASAARANRVAGCAFRLPGNAAVWRLHTVVRPWPVAMPMVRHTAVWLRLELLAASLGGQQSD